MKKLLLTLLAVFFISGSIFASGFQINESGAKAMSMAGAFTGVANDASAGFLQSCRNDVFRGNAGYGGRNSYFAHRHFQRRRSGD
ncbi:MAG: hypothetical protein GXO87_00780 [Chlorobi bacterium]|nr:hypothetical protein [Chlorobiota bacterium]